MIVLSAVVGGLLILRGAALVQDKKNFYGYASIALGVLAVVYGYYFSAYLLGFNHA
jgi:hypothetical protein